MSKQVIVMRKDLDMPSGKLVAQGSHASLAVFLNMMNGGTSLLEQTPTIEDEAYTLTLHVPVDSNLDRWLRGIFTKVVLEVHSEEELLSIYMKAKEAGLPVALIEDNGLTVFKGVKTKTCLAIGPDDAEAINQVTRKLRLYK